MATKVNNETSIQISTLDVTTSRFGLVGITPMIQNRLPEKARQELLMPKGKKTAAERASTLKHDPLAEFRSSIHRIADPKAATLIGMPASAVKKAIASAALDIPGAKKSQIGRLTFVRGDVVPVYGVPQVLCSIVRSADMNKTPDVRSRAILAKWAMTVEIEHPGELISSTSLANLLAAAGRFVGLGDWRTEKGAGNYGGFSVMLPTDPEFQAIVKGGGRAAQAKAMESPTSFNDETDELLGWFSVELKRRGFKVAA